MTVEATNSSPRLLVVDDDADLRSLMIEYFGRHGFTVHGASGAPDAFRLLDEAVPEVVIVDLHLPAGESLTMARRLRRAHPSMGIVMLDAVVGEPSDRIRLELGVDDYLPKPFDNRELLRRVRGLLRCIGRTAKPLAEDVPYQPRPSDVPAVRQRIAFGACSLDLEARSLFAIDGTEIPTTAAEFDLLELLSRHPNRPLSRNRIMEHTRNQAWNVFDRSIDLQVMKLRRKIERNPDKPVVIKTVCSVGYVFMAPPSK
ncbi:winged helix-turn-helix domain-containing protein [Aquabacterium humicola]|uniref:winged helix-turn-helix domain-containing protein n=1 Tax=Aquabacterium humicola TaxID=3237377 RepID=UPI002543DADF|nr:winged helix-turn-helix domain-containing protein [Rubrivivax pictus]